MFQNLRFALLVVMSLNFAENEAKPGDCEYSETAQMEKCQFFCGFSTSWYYCLFDICCCGYNDGNVWQSFRLSEGERGCRDDPPPKPTPIGCIASECQTACAPLDYKCDEDICFCLDMRLYQDRLQPVQLYKYKH